MKCLLRCILLLNVAALLALATEVTPIQKILKMLADMKKNGEKEMAEEEVQYAAYKQFCELTTVEKERAIDKSEDAIIDLDARIEKNGALAERLATEVATHLQEISTAEADISNTTDIRNTGREDFAALFTDYTESIDAIGLALKTLKAKDKKTAQAPKDAETALLQLKKSRVVPDEAKTKISSFLAADAGLFEEDELARAISPEADAYNFQSGGVIDMLEKLEEKFMDQRTEAEKDEAKAKHVFEMRIQNLKAQVKEAETSRDTKTATRNKALSTKADEEGQLAETQGVKDGDEKYLKELKETCAKKAEEFAERQHIRKEEITAIEEASEIIAGDTVSKAPNARPTKKTSLASLRAAGEKSGHGSPELAEVARFLQKEASSLNSRVLSALAARAAADPLKKVRDMIETLITRLNEEMQQQATKQAWCTRELKQNKFTRDEKTSMAESLNADIDQNKADITKLAEEISTINGELTELAANMANATALRKKEKEENTAVIKDTRAAQAAVQQAIGVLKDFYAKAAEAAEAKAALLQTGSKQQPKAPEIFGGEAYDGQKDKKEGVVNMLQVLEADFARLLAETEAAESASEKAYTSFDTEAQVNKVAKEKEVDHKTLRKGQKAAELASNEADLRGNNKELEAADKYFEKLRPDCIDTGPTFEEREAKRKQEIKDLQAALEMLTGETA
eukprot:TRINITY_DN47837_c0_g1_i1.p1 TRINITY_DN47837_c0_g1~~TRINITY_DN47837_c0_g1_i1.p1  ORF type:complete len:685 (-),score=274.44 TRINITY_DN47837_c0_g1_i1:236-2290(-)